MDGGAGHCLCGSVSYRFDGPPNWQAHCHCESCRRNCSAPFTSYFGVSHGKWRWTGTAPQVYVSSPGVRRHFCATCGTPMAFEGENWAHEIHFYAASLNDPSAFEPTLHVNWNEHLPWVKLDDGLKRMRMPRRMRPEEDFGPVLALIRAAFAYMEGRIDPPSSVHRLTADALSARAANEEIWVLEDLGHPIACVVLTPEADHLYLGKLAVAEDCRGQGLARQLVRHAMARATALGLPELRLQTRVELEENQRAFAAMGFSETGRTAHEGHDLPTSISFALRV